MAAELAIQPQPMARVGAGSGAGDTALRLLTAGSAAVILILLGTLVLVLFVAAVPSFRTFGARFLTDSTWDPNEREVQVRDANHHIVFGADGEPLTQTIPAHFGALAFIYGTAVSSAIALAVAIPVSFGAALFLVRISVKSLAAPVAFLIEFLAAIPSIAFGLWGLFVVAPHVGRNMLCGGLILAIMILPIITSIARDVLRSVPRVQIEGSAALGATWWQSSKEMLLYGRSGLFGAVMLGLARAAGETMAVTMVIGNANQVKASLLAPAQTMSSLLANTFAEASTDLEKSALLEVALILLLMSLLFNVVARWLIVGKGPGRTV